jgi:COP9 signalosome complex subunit 1
MHGEAVNIDYSGEENDNETDTNYATDFEVNNSSIDLDLYTSGYNGFMRISRLMFLAEHCPPLRVDALRLALSYVLETYNTNLYSVINKQLAEAYNRQ